MVFQNTLHQSIQSCNIQNEQVQGRTHFNLHVKQQDEPTLLTTPPSPLSIGP